MSANQADFPVAMMARVLGVSKAGYHAWAGREPAARAMADAALLKRIQGHDLEKIWPSRRASRAP